MHCSSKLTRLAFALTSILVLVILSACETENNDQAETEPSMEAASTPVADQLTARREAFKEKAPEGARRVMTESLDSLRRSGILESALNVGDTIPTFELPGAIGDPLNISGILAEGPLVLVFYRGNW